MHTAWWARYYLAIHELPRLELEIGRETGIQCVLTMLKVSSTTSCARPQILMSVSYDSRFETRSKCNRLDPDCRAYTGILLCPAGEGGRGPRFPWPQDPDAMTDAMLLHPLNSIVRNPLEMKRLYKCIIGSTDNRRGEGEDTGQPSRILRRFREPIGRRHTFPARRSAYTSQPPNSTTSHRPAQQPFLD